MSTSKTPGQEEEQRLLKLVNSNGILQSLLYDLDLLPEQLERGSVKWNHMLLIAIHWDAHTKTVLAARLKPEHHSCNKCGETIKTTCYHGLCGLCADDERNRQ